MKRKLLGKTFLGLLILFLLAQFIPRPAKNEGEIRGAAYISATHPVPAEVEQIFKASCFDCHSNKTNYPWYASIQPLALWLGNHVEDGKKHLNFSEFSAKPLAVQFHKLEEIEEQVNNGEMPLESFTAIHRDAAITDNQKLILINWSRVARDSMRKTHPADSLVMKRKSRS